MENCPAGPNKQLELGSLNIVSQNGDFDKSAGVGDLKTPTAIPLNKMFMEPPDKISNINKNSSLVSAYLNLEKKLFQIIGFRLSNFALNLRTTFIINNYLLPSLIFTCLMLSKIFSGLTAGILIEGLIFCYALQISILRFQG